MPFVKSHGYVAFHDFHYEFGHEVKKFVIELGNCTVHAGEFGTAIWHKP